VITDNYLKVRAKGHPDAFFFFAGRPDRELYNQARGHAAAVRGTVSVFRHYSKCPFKTIGVNPPQLEIVQ
jgi:hypothetical protein